MIYNSFGMKRSNVIDRRRAHISDAVRGRVDMSFRICGNPLYTVENAWRTSR